eukprot:2105554-Rhodomonas_salina.1
MKLPLVELYTDMGLFLNHVVESEINPPPSPRSSQQFRSEAMQRRGPGFEDNDTKQLLNSEWEWKYEVCYLVKQLDGAMDEWSVTKAETGQLKRVGELEGTDMHPNLREGVEKMLEVYKRLDQLVEETCLEIEQGEDMQADVVEEAEDDST